MSLRRRLSLILNGISISTSPQSMTTSHRYAYAVPSTRKNTQANSPGSSRNRPDLHVPPALARQIATRDTTYFPAFTTCSTRSRDPRLAS